MANPLRYTPAKSTKRADLNRPYFGYGAAAEWAGVEEAARGGMKLAAAVGQINNHLDEVEDSNALNNAGADIEIYMGQRITEYETVGADPDNYQRDVQRMFDETVQGVSKNYQFKTKTGQAAFNNKLAQLKSFYEIKAMKRGMDMRIQRGIADFNESVYKTGQAASMYENVNLAQGYLDVTLPDMIKDGVHQGLMTADKGQELEYKIRNNTDWYYANEQAEGNPDYMIDLTSNEKKFFGVYKYLAPNQLQDLRKTAIAQKKANETAAKKIKEAKDKTAQREFNSRLNEMMVGIRDEPTIAGMQEAYQHIQKGLKDGLITEPRADTLTEVIQGAPFKTSPRTDALITMDIHSGKIDDPEDIWDYVGLGKLSPEDVEKKQKQLLDWKKQRGGGADRLTENVDRFRADVTYDVAGDDAPSNEEKMEIENRVAQFTNSLRLYMESENIPMYSPRVDSLAERLKEKIVTKEGLILNERKAVYQTYDLKSHKMPDDVYRLISPDFPERTPQEMNAAFKWLWDNNYDINKDTIGYAFELMDENPELTDEEVVP